MKTKHYILLALIGLSAFFTGLFIGKGRTENHPGTVTETKETTVDTIPYYAPMPLSELAIGTQSYTLPVYRFIARRSAKADYIDGGYVSEPQEGNDCDSVCVDSIITAHYGTGAGGEPRCCDDSAIVELPIIQRHYADSTYEAWISGPVDPRLDSVRVFAPTTVITKQEWKPPKRWHIGPTVGFGYTPHGFEPFIGISLTYSIIDL